MQYNTHTNHIILTSSGQLRPFWSVSKTMHIPGRVHMLSSGFNTGLILFAWQSLYLFGSYLQSLKRSKGFVNSSQTNISFTRQNESYANCNGPPLSQPILLGFFLGYPGNRLKASIFSQSTLCSKEDVWAYMRGCGGDTNGWIYSSSSSSRHSAESPIDKAAVPPPA